MIETVPDVAGIRRTNELPSDLDDVAAGAVDRRRGADHGIRRTAVIFVGHVLGPRRSDVTDSYLYSHARMTKLRADRHSTP